MLWRWLVQGIGLMMTQTHLLVAAALFTRPGSIRRNTAVIAGSLIPDLAIFVLFGWAISQGISQETLWNETYWTEPWQTLTAAGNSFPLYALLFVTALVIARPSDGRPHWQSLPALFALAALTHLAGDFPLHNDDAHQHFWPISEWRFQSPVSYWDRDHNANLVAPLELIFGAGLALILFRRFKNWGIRIMLGSLLLFYAAVPIFFLLQLS